MRFNEISRGGQHHSEVYLDMDGVLADFFVEYAKLAGVTSGNYRDIPPAKTDPTLDKMVGTDFFARLPKFPTADSLVAMVVKIFGSYNICSSPLRGDHENSEKQKKIWIQEHLDPQPNKIIITPRKQKYAVQPDGTPNILIDDRGSNITAWEEAGGVGIKYQADEDGLDVIVRGLRRAINIIRGEQDHVPQKLVSRDRSMPVATVLDKPTLSIDGVAAKHGLDPDQVYKLLQQGIRVEMEHTNDPQVAREIALDHLSERPDYYKLLSKVEKNINEGLYIDVPNEDWLRDKIEYAQSKKRNSFGVPYMGSTTAYTRQDVRVPVDILKRLPGMRGEQKNVRKDDLFAIMKIMKTTGKLPTLDSGKEYAPFINVAYNGEAWVNEGNHRIMAAAALGWDSLPVQISYFDGGERVEDGPMYPEKIGLGKPVDENFHDGRVKGKSRPGRVKRAGASCKGSVTSLRAKAKKYGGEKGKMYHWCANMKGGKK